MLCRALRRSGRDAVRRMAAAGGSPSSIRSRANSAALGVQRRLGGPAPQKRSARNDALNLQDGPRAIRWHRPRKRLLGSATKRESSPTSRRNHGAVPRRCRQGQLRTPEGSGLRRGARRTDFTRALSLAPMEPGSKSASVPPRHRRQYPTADRRFARHTATARHAIVLRVNKAAHRLRGGVAPTDRRENPSAHRIGASLHACAGSDEKSRHEVRLASPRQSRASAAAHCRGHPDPEAARRPPLSGLHATSVVAASLAKCTRTRKLGLASSRL